MEYDPSDSSGTDDDLPPSHQNRGLRREPVTATIVGSVPYPERQYDMEAEIHSLEKEAYSSVLRAFKAQSDAITWEKESLLTELRKELRVSDREHRELLSCVDTDGIIQRIREWRQVGRPQIGVRSNTQPDVSVPIPTISASRKRQKMFQPVPSQSLRASSPLMHNQPAFAFMQPSSSAVQKRALLQSKGKKPKPISPEDIRWHAVNTGINQPSGQGALGNTKSTSRSDVVPGVGRGTGALKNQATMDFHLPKHCRGNKCTSEIKIFNTKNVLKEATKVFSTNHTNSPEIEKAKQLLKDQERFLTDAITRVTEAIHGESGDDQFSHGQLMDRDHGLRNLQHGGNQRSANYADDMDAEAREGSDEDHMVGDDHYNHDGDGYM